MRRPAHRTRAARWIIIALGALFAGALALADRSAEPRWVGAWATAPLAESAENDSTPLAGATLRQVVRVSLGGQMIRLRLSNAFGATPLVVQGATLALAAADGAVTPGSNRAVTFAGQPGVTIPVGASYLSDPLGFSVAPLADVAITLHLGDVPLTLTVHGGSRAHSFLQPGDALDADRLPAAKRIVRWYFINALDVAAPSPQAAAVVLLGDSITDGYGTQPDSHTRWPDFFMRRLAERGPGAAPLGVLNLGIGGNRLLGEGLGQNALARFDRDVLGQAGARWLVIFEGVNDLGHRKGAREKGQPFPSADELIGAYEQLIARARTHGLRVIGGTITPFEGAQYWTPEGEADRQRINDWIRTSGRFDAVIDFDAAVRDPARPTRFLPRYDCGDHLHPSIDGYRRLAEAVDLALFTP